MSKVKWGLAGIVVLAGGMAGANFYADQRLKDYYQVQPHSKDLLQMAYKHFDMGIFSGSADWTMAIMFDPCQPNKMIDLKGQDKIQRSLWGYHIESQFILDADQHNDLQKIYQKPIVIVTDITWFGKMKTTIKLPEMNVQQNGIKIIGSASEIEIQSKREQDQLKIVHFSSQLNKIQMQKDDFKLIAQNIHIESDYSGVNTTVFEEGKSKIDIENIHVSIARTAASTVELKNLSLSAETKLQKRTVDFISQMRLNYLSVGQRHFSDLAVNFDLTDLNKEKIQHIFNRYDQLLHECKPNTHIIQALDNDFLTLVAHGMTFKSEGNQIKSGQAMAKLSMNGRILPEHHINKKAFFDALPNVMEYKMNAEMDKNILKMFKPDATSIEMDRMIDQLVQKTHAQRKGDAIYISMQYKHGEKKFMTEIPKD